jgi:hypothetical protein
MKVSFFLTMREHCVVYFQLLVNKNTVNYLFHTYLSNA